jgi:starvation-inducible DNA-binding protein
MPTMMTSQPPTRNPLVETTRLAIGAVLNARLADGVDLWLQAKQAHWNVRGPNFIALHKLFDEVAEAMEANVDLLAERVAQLGGLAHGTVQAAAAGSTLTAYPLDMVDEDAHVLAISLGLAGFATALQPDIERCTREKDAGSADLLIEVSRSAEKYLWFVEAHLKERKAERSL